jgi:hypothetical protein
MYDLEKKLFNARFISPAPAVDPKLSSEVLTPQNSKPPKASKFPITV